MKRWQIGAAAAAACALAGIGLWAPWDAPPQLVYETVAGYPMKVYYHNVGPAAEVTAFGGMPAVSDAPLSVDEIEKRMVEARKHVQPAPDLIRMGERTRFVLDDPERLAWVKGDDDHPVYFYIFAILESPRNSLISSRWDNELCLVAKTGEPFKRCPRKDNGRRI